MEMLPTLSAEVNAIWGKSPNSTDLGAILIYLFGEKLIIPTDRATFLPLCLRLLMKLFVKYAESTQCISTVYTMVINLTPAPSPLLQRTGTVVDALKPALCPAGGSVSKILATQA